jgi:hypothetical protein
MWRPVGRIGIVLAASVLAQSCGGASQRPPLPLEQFETQFVAIGCQKVFACCDATELAALGPAIVDEASCRSDLGANPNFTATQALVADGTVKYDGYKARACLDVLAALSCAEWAGGNSLDRFPNCDGILVGAGPAGSACASDAVCASGRCSSDPNTGGSLSCVAPAQRGESCELAPCAAGLSCVLGPSGGPRTCGDPFPDGASCSFDADCATRSCLPNSTGQGSSCALPDYCNGV